MSTAATTETPVGTTTPAPDQVPTSTEWTSGFAEDLKGYVTTKGFKDPAAVVDSYRNLEKLVGVKDKLLQVPDNLGDDKAMESVWNRLGRPEKPEGYAIESKDEAFGKWAKETFHKAGLTSNQAKAVLDQYNSYMEAQNQQFEGTLKAEYEQKTNALKTEWGSAFDQNVNMAKAAAKQFGIDAETVNKLEGAMGFAQTMKFLQTIGSKIGEAAYVSGSSSANNTILSPSQAKDQISAKSKDPEFFKKLMAGDVQVKNEWEKLNKMAVGAYES